MKGGKGRKKVAGGEEKRERIVRGSRKVEEEGS